MPERYGVVRGGHLIEVENDYSLIVVNRERLFIDGRMVDERSVFLGDTRLHGELRDGDAVWSVMVEVSVGFFGGLERCVLIEGGTEYPLSEEKERASRPVSKDRKVLEAIRDNGGCVTPTGVAMATSLSVREAGALLSELAGGGHLTVEREGGTLVYALPGGREIEAS